ncbi:hypothetical protein SAMN05444266_11519 [Chitinophaga jiangningensis]|uniref:Uncharacterized protein n=1 Tax=Chitinophaga jiangningensis TaxID=1419482 RepID=A0A1M7MWS0_9BACT|nr:hypothetical protein [Chitinophaga jiangningensis]SHM95060.1 hypothetical protein SAMN05444266_11519 [Chitinophaga jiangningensis]
MNKYEFGFQSNKGNPYIFLMILSPLVTVPLLVLMENLNLPVFFIVILTPIIFGGYMMYKKGKARDEITLDNRGFTSSYYGRIDFNDIAEIVQLPWYRRNPPTMAIRLTSGKKIGWNLTYRGSIFNTSADAHTFDDFTTALADKLEARVQHKNPFVEQKAPETTSLAGQLQGEKKRNNSVYWTLPLGFVVALTGLIRTCGKDWLPNRNIDFGKVAARQEALYHQNIITARQIMDSMAVVNGPAFLYTNDTGAILKQMPDLEVEEATGIRVFQQTAANMEMQRFIEHPDSFPPRIFVIGTDTVFKKMTKSILNMDDSASRYLYLRVYDTSQHIKAPSFRGSTMDTTKYKVFDVTTAIPIYDTTKIGEAIEKAFPGMHLMLAQVHHRSSFKVYLTGRVSEGIPEHLFRKAVLELNKQFHAVKVDTTLFVSKTFFN